MVNTRDAEASMKKQEPNITNRSHIEKLGIFLDVYYSGWIFTLRELLLIGSCCYLGSLSDLFGSQYFIFIFLKKL